MGPHVAWLAVALFVCALLQALSGFGFALVAMPIVTLLLGLNEAAPLVAAAALFLYCINTLRLRRHANWRELLPMAAAAVAGIVPGFWLQAHVAPHAVRTILGAILILFALYSVFLPRAQGRLRPAWAWPLGFIAGALGAAYNIPGPPVVVYGTWRGWPRDEYRSTLQTFFLANGALVAGGHVVLGHYSRAVGLLLLVALPACLAGNLAGVLADRYVDKERFRLLVNLLILATGITLLS